MKNHIQPKKSPNLIKDDILNSIGQPIIVVDKKLEGISYNQNAGKLIGRIHTLTEMAGLINKEEEAKKFLKNCRSVLNTGKEKKQKLSIGKKKWDARIYAVKKNGITILLEPAAIAKTSANEDPYRQLLDSMADTFMLTNEDLRIVDINKKFCDLLGYSRDELLGSNSSKIDRFLSAPKIKALHKKSEKGHITFDTKNSNYKGEEIETEINMFLLKRDGKKYYGSIGRDITEYKKVQNRLKKTNDRFTFITNATRDALWELDVDTGERWANETHQRLYGLTGKDPVPPPSEWEKRIQPEVSKRLKESMELAIRKKEKYWNAEYWFRLKPGKSIYIYDRTLFTYDKKGNLSKMMGSMVDVTDLKSALEELTVQKDLSESIINALPGIFYLIDREGNFKRWNKNFENITGYTPDEIRKMSPADFMHEDYKENVDEIITNVFQKGWAEMEGPLLSKNGETLPYYLGGWKIIFENEECLIGTGVDLTEVKKAQERVKQMEQKISQQKIIEQKLISRAIITTQEKERNHIGRELHDNVNQLLAGTRLYLTMGAKKNPEFAEMIKYPVELLDSGIQEIRALTHRHITPTKDMDLKELTLGISDLMKAASINCELNYSIEANIDQDLMVNIYRILQEGTNNILKHSHAQNVSLSVYSQDGKIFIKTEDDGVGFDVEGKREGIGLENIKHRVSAYDGELEIITSLGEGCKINIVIPLPDYQK